MKVSLYNTIEKYINMYSIYVALISVQAVSLIPCGLYTCCCKRKRISKPRCTLFPRNTSFNPETVAKRCELECGPAVSHTSKRRYTSFVQSNWSVCIHNIQIKCQQWHGSFSAFSRNLDWRKACTPHFHQLTKCAHIMFCARSYT